MDREVLDIGRRRDQSMGRRSRRRRLDGILSVLCSTWLTGGRCCGSCIMLG